MIEAMSEDDFSELKVFLNTSFGKRKKVCLGLGMPQ